MKTIPFSSGMKPLKEVEIFVSLFLNFHFKSWIKNDYQTNQYPGFTSVNDLPGSPSSLLNLGNM